MRIMHFLVGRCNPESANGVDKTIYYLSKAQAKLGHEVNVVAITSKPKILIPGVQLHHYPARRKYFSLSEELTGFISDYQPQIVHMHSVYTPQNWYLSKLLLRSNIPYVITPHGGLNHYILKRNKLKKQLYKILFELPILNRAFFIHAVGDKDDIQLYGAKTPIITIPNGFDLTSIPSQIDPNYLKNKLQPFRNKRIFVFVGRLDIFHKGLDLLVQAFSQSDHTKACLVFIGPDWKNNKQTLIKLAYRLKLEKDIFFLGPAYSGEKFNIIAGSDVFVNTSRWEGLPFAVLEACAMKKPCIVSDAANLTKLLEKYQAGILVKPEIRAIATALDQFIEMRPEQLSEMGRNAHKMVEAELRWENIALRLVQEYEKHSNV